MSLGRLCTCIREFTRLVSDAGLSETQILHEGRALLGALIARDDWLPDQFAAPDPQRYRQYLLHCDPLERFSIVSFVWGPGQRTPVHDHTVWGLVGVLHGAERSIGYRPGTGGALEPTAESQLAPGDIEAVSPRIGDVHAVFNALADRPSISIHVYGGNIGAVARHTYDAATGRPEPFVSGYCNAVLPNPWDPTASGVAAGSVKQ
ncbi:MAG: cysteine dioxygenase [Proteobacteria bacterium]|nr:cysteine dioxygenase [Pseudomonadota bacterium]